MGGGLIDGGVGSASGIGNLWRGWWLKWADICETSLNWGVSNRLGGHSYVTNCKD